MYVLSIEMIYVLGGLNVAHGSPHIRLCAAKRLTVYRTVESGVPPPRSLGELRTLHLTDQNTEMPCFLLCVNP